MKCVQMASSIAPKEWKSKIEVRASGKEITKECVAVFDTGAYISAISKNLFDSIQAETKYHADNHTPTGREVVSVCDIDIAFYDGGIINNTEATISTHDMDCDILIGMNVITKGDFHSFRDSDGLYKCTFKVYDTLVNSFKNN